MLPTLLQALDSSEGRFGCTGVVATRAYDVSVCSVYSANFCLNAAPLCRSQLCFLARLSSDRCKVVDHNPNALEKRRMLSAVASVSSSFGSVEPRRVQIRWSRERSISNQRHRLHCRSRHFDARRVNGRYAKVRWLTLALGDRRLRPITERQVVWVSCDETRITPRCLCRDIVYGDGVNAGKLSRRRGLRPASTPVHRQCGRRKRLINVVVLEVDGGHAVVWNETN